MSSRHQAPPVLAQGCLGGAGPDEGDPEGAELDSGVWELGGVDQDSCVGGVCVLAVQLGQLQFLVDRPVKYMGVKVMLLDFTVRC